MRTMGGCNRFFGAALLAAALALVALCAASRTLELPAQELARRLILKDGSYQMVTRYEVKGDRVHYYSAEREDWEDLPSSLVDWPATEQYEKDRAAGASTPEAVQLDKEVENESARQEAERPQVAPGLRLPEGSGVFLLDSFQGEPQLVEIPQNSGDVNTNRKVNILHSVVNPVASAKANIELDGGHATVQAHAVVPSIYLNTEDSPEMALETPQGPHIILDSPRSEAEKPQQPQQPEQPVLPFDRFRIVRVEVKGNKRIVGDVKRNIAGKVTQEQHFVKTTVARVTGGWLKVTPTESLAPGEYALVEMMGQEGMNLYLWDFGVNPKAPANANPWKPETKGEKPAVKSGDPQK